MVSLEERFKNWLLQQGLSEKTPKGNPSTIYDYVRTINRVRKKEGHLSWDELAVNVMAIIPNYKGKPKTALRKYNTFLFETEQSKDVVYQRNENFLYALSQSDKEEILKKGYLTTQELADFLGLDIRQIKRWRENRIDQKKLDQLEENPKGRKPIGPKFTQVGGVYRYYKDDLDKYFHRPIEKM